MTDLKFIGQLDYLWHRLGNCHTVAVAADWLCSGLINPGAKLLSSKDLCRERFLSRGCLCVPVCTLDSVLGSKHLKNFRLS